jgi:hypothetical protein
LSTPVRFDRGGAPLTVPSWVAMLNRFPSAQQQTSVAPGHREPFRECESRAVPVRPARYSDKIFVANR